jgi:hypothetical protein
VRRIALVALVAAAGCNQVSELQPGPADRFYFPTGAAVTAAGQLVVASSNFDLRYDEDTGGSVIAVDPAQEPAPDLAGLLGAVNVRSLAGQLAIADPATCPAVLDPAAGAVAVVPVRGSNVVYRLRVAASGAVSCPGCEVQVGGTSHVDPWAAGIACGPGIARAFVGHLRTSGLVYPAAWVTQLDLSKDPSAPDAVQHFAWDYGQARGFAYDAEQERLYVTHTVTGAATSLRWVDLGGKVACDGDPASLCACRVDRGFASGGCATGESVAGAVPQGIELRGVALSHSPTPFRRAYFTARVYDPVLAAAAGARTTEFDGKLLVADLVETLDGRLDLAVVGEIDLGYGASDVVVLPERAGKRDLVAALATDSGRITIYDDETGTVVGIGANLEGEPATGAPLVGHAPIALALDPVPKAGGTVARLYAVSFQESFVTPIDVPLEDPAAACLVAPAGGCASGPATVRHIKGGVAP